LTRKDAQLFYDWLIAHFGDPTLEGAPHKALLVAGRRFKLKKKEASLLIGNKKF
jgi:hypothetical protein